MRLRQRAPWFTTDELPVREMGCPFCQRRVILVRGIYAPKHCPECNAELVKIKVKSGKVR